jgi:hypothetical protein
MDSAEEVISKTLSFMELTEIEFEPLGNTPPDFVAGNIAIEVTRLNQRYDDGDGSKALLEKAIPLDQKIEKMLRSFGKAQGKSWFVSYGFYRPIPSFKTLEPKLREALNQFISSSNKKNQLIYNDGNFNMDVCEASNVHEQYFIIGGRQDYQCGGNVLAEIISSIEYSSREKLSKVKPYRHKYENWWLALVNTTQLVLDQNNLKLLLECYRRPKEWEKVLLVMDPSKPDIWLEL